MNQLIYILHSGNLYGTEQMALRTLVGLQNNCEAVLLAPPGPVHKAALDMGIKAVEFASNKALLKAVFAQVWHAKKAGHELQCIDTGLKHALMVRLASKLLGKPVKHLHIVHGGTDERLSYGRKKLLIPLGVQLVAVSEFVKTRLVEHGCRADAVKVIHNFQQPLGLPKRASYVEQPTLRRIAVVSRLDPIKRVDMVIDAVQEFSGLSAFEFDIYGAGQDMEAIRARAANFPNINIHGFVPDASKRIAQADLLLHTCATEPFGLAILEAFEAGVLVMVPNRGGASELVQHQANGLQFAANDSRKMARAILELNRLNAHQVQAMVDKAHESLQTQYSPVRGVASYKALLGGSYAQAV